MNFTEVQKLVYQMLTENTGIHLLDSGGEDGMHFQTNSKRSIEDFYNDPEESYVWDGSYLTREVSVFHYLSDLRLDAICEKFNDLNSDAEDWDADTEVHGVSVRAWDYLTEYYEVQVIRTFNTYNGESDLSQVLQGGWITISGNSYLLLQIHNGADVRGGYTNARLFMPSEDGLIHEYLLEWFDEYDYRDEWDHLEIYDETDEPISEETKEKILDSFF